jgi:hypothetical protein
LIKLIEVDVVLEEESKQYEGEFDQDEISDL